MWWKASKTYIESRPKKKKTSVRGTKIRCYRILLPMHMPWENGCAVPNHSYHVGIVQLPLRGVCKNPPRQVSGLCHADEAETAVHCCLIPARVIFFVWAGVRWWPHHGAHWCFHLAFRPFSQLRFIRNYQLRFQYLHRSLLRSPCVNREINRFYCAWVGNNISSSA